MHHALRATRACVLGGGAGMVAIARRATVVSVAAATAATTTMNQQHVVQQQISTMFRRWKGYSALTDVVRDSVANRVIDQATRDDSSLWKEHDLNGTSSASGSASSRTGAAAPSSQQEREASQQLNGLNGQHHSHHEHPIHSGSVNESTSSAELLTLSSFGVDPLNDLFLTDATRYWPALPSGVRSNVDATFALVQAELKQLAESIRQDLIGTDHPVLNQAASYFFDSAVAADGGKKVRPMMVLLLSRALADSSAAQAATTAPAASTTQSSVSSNSHNMEHTNLAVDDTTLFTTPQLWQRHDLPAAQRRLAEISELIHTASLFHDDVIDGADTRRGVAAVHVVFGNKMAILAGDYLLARASICLARLRHVEVVETMSTIIEHLVRGEVMQLRNNAGNSNSNSNTNSSTSRRNEDRIYYYLRKNFYKTGSLMANSCKSAALLGEYSADLVDASYRFGKHVGMSFQLVDDVLDFEGTLSQLGKPALADLKAGLATAPVLFAAEEYPQLEALIDRKFKQEGDVDTAVDLVFRSSGIERTKELARVHAEYAMDALLCLHPSASRDALLHLANKVVARTK